VLTRIPVAKKATAASVIPIVRVTEAIKIGREAIHSSKRFTRFILSMCISFFRTFDDDDDDKNDDDVHVGNDANKCGLLLY
jgi:hypothetical protein